MDRKGKSATLKQAEVQCWLEEHRALRNEIELHFTSIGYMIMLNITAIGTIASFALSINQLLLLIIPILSATIGFIVYVHSRRMSQLGHYIESRIKPKLADIIGDTEVLGWESYIRELEGKGNRVFKWFANAGMGFWTFAIPSILALIFSAKQALAAESGWRALWGIGLFLTIIAIPVFMGERTFWFKKVKEE